MFIFLINIEVETKYYFYINPMTKKKLVKLYLRYKVLVIKYKMNTKDNKYSDEKFNLQIKYLKLLKRIKFEPKTWLSC